MRLFLILYGLLMGLEVLAGGPEGFPDAVEAVSPPVAQWDGRVTPVNNQPIAVSRTTPPSLPMQPGFSAFTPPRKNPDEPERRGVYDITDRLVFLTGDGSDDDSSDEELSLLGGSLHPRVLTHPSPLPLEGDEPAPTNWIQKVREFKQMKDELSNGLGTRSPTPSTEEAAKAYFLSKQRRAGLQRVGNPELLARFEAEKALAEVE